MALFSFAGSRPSHLGIHGGRLAPCPASPSCVSSDAEDGVHATHPFELAVAPAEAWRVVRSLLGDLPRTKLMTATSDYVHAECSSAVFGFVDDLELHLRPSHGIIAVRSAARHGYSDLGINRKRVEKLRALLIKPGRRAVNEATGACSVVIAGQYNTKSAAALEIGFKFKGCVQE